MIYKIQELPSLSSNRYSKNTRIAQMNKYKKSDLEIHAYGSGRNKCFIMYTDYDSKEYRWNTKVYPDINGNKAKAVAQVLRWLNNPDIHNRAPIVKGFTKVSITYTG